MLHGQSTTATGPRLARETLILLGFLAFAVYATWPLVTKMFSSFSDAADAYQFAWNLWWTKEQLFSLENPWYTDQLLAPAGSNLGYATLAPLVGLLMAPVTAVFGAGLAFNLTGLVFPAARSVRDAQLTGRSEKSPVVAALVVPEPLARSPSQLVVARRMAGIGIGPPV
jgi:hypothetical protein